MQNHNIKIGKSLEVVKYFRYLWEQPKQIKNCILEEITSRLKVRGCLLSGAESFLFQFVVLYGCESWSLALREEHRLGVFEDCCGRYLGLRGTR
jgi:hypothetical protein